MKLLLFIKELFKTIIIGAVALLVIAAIISLMNHGHFYFCDFIKLF